jgi:hypothetical protein
VGIRRARGEMRGAFVGNVEQRIIEPSSTQRNRCHTDPGTSFARTHAEKGDYVP